MLLFLEGESEVVLVSTWLYFLHTFFMTWQCAKKFGKLSIHMAKDLSTQREYV